MLTTVLFIVLALVAVAAGIAVFRTDSMARATYALAASFVAVGAMLLQFNLDYIGVVTILMMVMEMAIMAIFMIMFMGMNPALMPMSMVHNKRGSLLIAGGVFLVLAAGALLVPWPARRGAPAPDLTVSLGEAIMGNKMLVMLTVSPLLFATLVSALVLANPRGRYRPYPKLPAPKQSESGPEHHGHTGGGH
ncbi:NADH-quinone oxidoreductase subunit J [Paenarthrobacter sp. DKR-5]|uniref:NADH-quinone oxidoreductase subunit J n=1 Tax=Paenarthrobacter sp. DKR-5 TaxID=2835535 RepID=UPI001BDC34A3|nr:NADH-quinone oxidoreductase subunit J [Paenarthrobacter sp. DKR-5]MBT1003895.1 NADH-quinone oxidoreductase subunit J [Paenarthrobacter sp. DKR-5]